MLDSSLGGATSSSSVRISSSSEPSANVPGPSAMAAVSPIRASACLTVPSPGSPVMLLSSGGELGVSSSSPNVSSGGKGRSRKRDSSGK